MSTCSTSEALELQLKGTVICHTLKPLRLMQGRPLRVKSERLLHHCAVSLDGAKVSDPFLRMVLQMGETVLVHVSRLKLQRWVIQ